MYNIGICDDGKGICASLEEMVQQYAKEKKISLETMVWYTAEKLCSYLALWAFPFSFHRKGVFGMQSVQVI